MDFLISVLTGAILLGILFGSIIGLVMAVSFWPMYVGVPLLGAFIIAICWAAGSTARGIK